jgi:predicted acylesterase/phospholipase RssA
MIKNIVLSGGAYLGLLEFGVLQYLNENLYYDISEIEKIYGTSIGGFIGAILCLKIDMKDVIEYITDRPWHNLISFSPSILSDFYSKKGFINKNICEIALSNLLRSVDLDTNITLKNFYEYSNIELHLYTISLSDFELKDLSYKTYPDLLLVDAIYMSCSVPYIFQPLNIEGEYYIDGGFICNYPISYCIKDNAKEDEILAIAFNNSGKTKHISEQNIFEFVYLIHNKLTQFTRQKNNNLNIKNEIIIDCDGLNLEDAHNLIFSKELRQSYIKRGYDFAEHFLQNL